MALRGIEIGLGLVLVMALLFSKSEAQSGCTNTLLGLTPCLNYVSGNSSTPSSTCCSQLSNVVQAQPQCLCLLLDGTASSYGYNINQTLALALPGACNVKTPPVSQCKALSPSSPPSSPPSSSPEDDTPTDETPTSSSTPTTTISSGSKTVPATRGSTSNGSILKFSLCPLALALIIASYFSNTLVF